MSAITKPHASLVGTKAGREGGVFTYNVTWKILVDIDTATPNNMLADQIGSLFTGLPNEGSVYPFNTDATCRKVDVNMVKRGVYTYSASYTDAGGLTDQNPLLDEPVVAWNGTQDNIAIYKDRDQEAIQNTAGDAVIDNMDDNKIGVTVKVNVAAVPIWLLTYRNTCNNAPINVSGLGIPTNGARIILPGGFVSEKKQRNGITYYVFTYVLEFDELDLHYGKPLNAGFRQKKSAPTPADPNATQLVACLDGSGDPVSEPVPLDANGVQIAEPTPATTILLDVKKYREVDFSVLPGISAI